MLSRFAPVLAVALAVLCLPALASAATPKAPQPWATVNICDTPAKPLWIGLRGSMPGVARKGATKWMRFAVQYRTPSKAWKAVAGLQTAYLPLGSARGETDAGHSFRVKPPSAGGEFTLRGLVTFQWRTKGGTVIKTVQRVTTAGHKGTAGADPEGYSAATCTID